MIVGRALLAALVGLFVLTAPAVAQVPHAGKIHRIGLLAPRAASVTMDAFVSAMREHGWPEGRSYTLEARYTGGNLERARAFADELVASNVDVLLTITTAHARAARQASRTVPIVMLTSGFPVEAGLAASVARPGGNVTGLSAYADASVFAKYVQLLKEVAPALRSLAVLWNYVPPGFAQEEVDASLGQMKRAAVAIGLTPRVFEIHSRTDLARALAVLGGERVDAMFMTSTGPVFAEQSAITDMVTFSLKRKIPTLTDVDGPLFAAGGLMTYSPSNAELGRRGAAFVDRILRGARPGDLPIELPTKFELIINAKTAKALGLTIPPSLLARADRVIE